MKKTILLILVILCIVIWQAMPGLETTSSEEPTPSVAVEEKTAGTQSLMDNLAARMERPGKAHYDKVCASCHEGAVAKAPHREMLYLQTPEAIYSAITEGVMVTQAAALTERERIEVAEFLGGQAMGTASTSKIPSCDATVAFSAEDTPSHSNSGAKGNQRNWTASQSGVSESDILSLEPLWAVELPGAIRLRSQPTLAGGFLYVGSHGGGVYALDQRSGCQVWHYKTVAEVRTGIAIDAWDSQDAKAQPQIYFGDVVGNVYALNARSGELVWRDRADNHHSSTITGAPALHAGVLYVPVSSLEVALAVNPEYECCTGSGSVVAYEADTGQRLWKTYTLSEQATVQSVNAAGTDMYGPSGSMVWNSPTIDTARNQLYVGTGENMSSPADNTSDALFAMDLATGKVNWIYQGLAGDAWNTACDTRTPDSCPEENGPDFDFGAGTLLVTTNSGRELVLGGQKSGHVHAVDPESGDLVWKTKVGRGGIQGGVHFGMAARNGKVFVPISDGPDGRDYPDPARPGLHALDAETGNILWYSAAPDVCEGRNFCDPGIGQAVSVVSGKIFAGGMDGVLRVHDENSGEVLYQIDTTKPFAAVAGQAATGGSFGGASGATAKNGLVAISSGYGIYNHMPGNLLLIMSAK
jgi:polyvinyl alcohol dehydrogenase (cytochrome)